MTTATDIGLQRLQDLRPDLSNMSVSDSRLVVGVLSVTGADGQNIYTSTSGVNAWVLQVDGPPQQGYTSVSGVILVDYATGKVLSASVLMTST